MDGRLSKYFVGVATKKLSAVEADPNVSNQHEFNGVALLKTILGRERRTFQTKYIYLSDDESTSFTDTGIMTWYDARENHPIRSEYRLYYTSNGVMEKALEGDYLVIGLQPNEEILMVVAREGSTSERQLMWLFDDEKEHEKFVVRDDTSKIPTGFASRFILNQMGLYIDEPLPSHYLDEMIERFGNKFPKTRVFSAYARETLEGVSYSQPDKAIIRWLEREEALFRMFERHLVENDISAGFTDVDDFVKMALSVINRRKSRVGAGFENHLEQLLINSGICYSTQQITENKSKPDFIFPHISIYHMMPEESLDKVVSILGVKYSCKDRWRQVLAEANKATTKYLLTVEAGISVNQTDEMENNGLRLIVPEEIHSSYSPTQREWIMSLGEFFDILTFKEKKEWKRYFPTKSLQEVIKEFDSYGE